MDIKSIIKPENLVYKRPELMNDVMMHYCPGCSHGVVHKLVAEVVADMGMQEDTIGVAPVGCAVFAYKFIDVDWQEAAHGRAPALATAIKRLNPDKWYLLIREMATLQLSVRLKRYTPAIEVRIS